MHFRISRVTATDDEGAFAIGNVKLTIAHVPPQPDDLRIVPTSVEGDGSLVVLTGHISDLGPLDTIDTIEFVWGDGTAIPTTPSHDPNTTATYNTATNRFTPT